MRTLADALRANYFVLPALAVALAFVAGRLVAGVDIGSWVGDGTVDSARAVLSTVASATITFASISFSVSLLIMQQGSSQFSPRVLHALMRDPFNRRVIAFVLATFTYCLVVLQQVRGPLGDDGEEVVPHFAVVIGLVAGIGAVLAVVAAINHTAHKMDVSQILAGIVQEAQRAAASPRRERLRPLPAPAHPPVGCSRTVVSFADDGWVRQVERGALLDAVAPGAVVRLETDVGRYATHSTALCTIWPAVPEERLDDVTDRARRAAQLGPTRTMSEDGAYAVRQLVDVALKALSPGVNDPTTAQDAIAHLGTVLADRITSPPIPTAYADGEGRQLLAPHAVSDGALAELALAELRGAAADKPTVCIYLMEMITAVVEAATAHGAADRVRPLLEQAQLLRAQAEAAGGLDHDRDRIDQACGRLFTADDGPGSPGMDRRALG